MQENSGKYAPPPPAALYATPNATISTLLPYNGLPPSAAPPPQSVTISYSTSSYLPNHPPSPLATSSTQYNTYPVAGQPIHSTNYPPNPGPYSATMYPYPQSSAAYPPPAATAHFQSPGCPPQQQPQTYHPPAGYPPYPPSGAPAGYPSGINIITPI